MPARRTHSRRGDSVSRRAAQKPSGHHGPLSASRGAPRHAPRARASPGGRLGSPPGSAPATPASRRGSTP
eukprot:14449940-Alexandrium_andersonii.AAC.1